MGYFETLSTLTDKLNATLAGMGLQVRANVTPSVVRLLSDDRAQLELASGIAIDAAAKVIPGATLGDAFEGRRSGWVREIAY
jgi:hypothetical protein